MNYGQQHRRRTLRLALIVCIVAAAAAAAVHGAEVMTEPTESSTACPHIVKRAAWGAARSKNVTYQLKPVAKVIVHHTTGERCPTIAACKEQVRGFQTAHQMQNGWSDIGYKYKSRLFLIGPATIYEGIGWHRVGAHLRGHNRDSIGVAFIGNFDQIRPTPRSLEQLDLLLQCGVELGELTDDYQLYGALQLQSTNSPGQRLYAKLQEHDHWTPWGN
ncbi:peptidoglycan recognition protein-like isoform X3 [Anopheles cruzii]|uniref:peptidoglycan recognition protein-like isoform X3 n=1 Tax=Anopheles cruzii TaxID=68878 RepID=UPI0022EC3795|nr:peptidoglycan recognition protein-like isoform X3 [Anopheles cruzii]